MFMIPKNKIELKIVFFGKKFLLHFKKYIVYYLVTLPKDKYKKNIYSFFSNF